MSLLQAGHVVTCAAVNHRDVDQPRQDASQVPQERGVGRDEGDDYQLHPGHVL